MQTLRLRRASWTTALRSLSHTAALAALLATMTNPAPRPAAQTSGPGVAAAIPAELGEQVLNGCKTELARLCAGVVPGEGRVLACLYAHGDKISGRCDYALYNAAAQLERAIGAMTYVASECRADLEAHCAGVDAGEGRVAQCLKDHASELSPRCDQALTEVGVK
jgi:Cysteine rich repeat